MFYVATAIHASFRKSRNNSDIEFIPDWIWRHFDEAIM